MGLWVKMGVFWGSAWRKKLGVDSDKKQEAALKAPLAGEARSMAGGAFGAPLPCALGC